MNKKEIKEQLLEIATAANSLAGAICSLTVRLSCDIMLDDEVENAEKESGHPMARVMHEPSFDRGGNVAIPKMRPVTLAFSNNDDTNHCGQDACECKVSCGNLEATVSCRNLLGMEVIGYGGGGTKCVGCPIESGNCVKVELVGGEYLCLKPQDDEKKVISFDEDEGNVMDDIREKTEAFMDYLDSIVSHEKD